MSEDNTINLKKSSINFANTNEVIKLLFEMETKINVMRQLLWEWNCSSDPVWENYRLKSVGETESDYEFINDDPDNNDEYEPSDAK